ncbi:unnamed protein product, partial [Larinioides sclopetarius]
ALHYYKRIRLNKVDRLLKLSEFLADTAKVYPGPGKEGLKLIEIDEPTVESEEIGHLIKKRKKNHDGE